MEGKKKFKPDKNHKLMDQVREVLRYYHYAYRTEQTYCDWIKRYLGFYGMKQHPRGMGAAEVEPKGVSPPKSSFWFSAPQWILFLIQLQSGHNGRNSRLFLF